jgi:hypothetical protein
VGLCNRGGPVRRRQRTGAGRYQLGGRVRTVPALGRAPGGTVREGQGRKYEHVARVGGTVPSACYCFVPLGLVYVGEGGGQQSGFLLSQNVGGAVGVVNGVWQLA